MKENNNITNYYPIRDGKYLNLENNKLYSNPRTINNYLSERGITAIEYCIKWDLVDKSDYVQCKICNKYADSIGKHLSVSHKEYGGIEQYKKQYGEDVEIISNNYKKHLSNKFKGENNINHKSKTTELQRQQKSPFSIEFWKLKYPSYSDDKLNELIQTFRDSALSDREFNTRLDYYIKRGFSEDEGLKLIKERQTTFSLDICIEKHGEEEGLKIWKERQDKWLKTLDDKTDEEKLEIKKKKLNGSGYSKISQDLFWNIQKHFKNNEHIKFKELNNEVILYDKNTNNVFAYDYIDFKNKKVIEFNGDFWHCNPNKYDENYIHRLTNKTAKKIWEFDKTKNNFMINKGYDILVIWESEYRINKDEVIKKCIDFIQS